MNHPSLASLPVVVIGAGPVGLAAAAHLLKRQLEPVVFEAGDKIGSGMRQWAHVRMFSPWHYSIDHAARELLEQQGWQAPEPDAYPTGGDVVERYLEPLAATPELAPRIRTATRVTAISRWRRDRMKDADRSTTPFLVRYVDTDGEHELLAQAVIDASGTMGIANTMGASGLPALGETAVEPNLFRGMPDVLGRDRERYANKRVLVVGSGHSAFNVMNDLATLANEAPGTQVHWALRRDSVARVLGGGDQDQLRERGRLGQAIARWLDQGLLTAHTGFHLQGLKQTAQGIVAWEGENELPPVDEVVSATGFRPDTSMLSELRLSLDPSTGAPTALAPLIDPNLHSCGSVRPHGAEELRHPDEGLYIVGMKSYGRAPTFLLLTGYEQVRSVVAAIAGDWDAARRVELQLPETGVCNTQFAETETVASGDCCAVSPPPASANGGCNAAANSCSTASRDSIKPAASACCG